MVVKEEMTLAQLLGPYGARSEQDLAAWLVEEGVPAPLAEAMRYCVLGGGKRLRPALVMLAFRAAEGESDLAARQAAAAVEMVHCYSLVHDDLPAMDDDTLRRGRPTAHVKFGQAMAILAGDALLTRAFGVLAMCPPPLVGPLTAELAQAAGAAGMIAGQVADMELCPVAPGAVGVEYIHSRKTAAILRACTRMGAICAGAQPRAVDALGEYGLKLGLAFQLVDDLLDATATAVELGKTPGKDAAAGKRTALSQIGLDAARKLAAELTAGAIDALATFGPAAEELRVLARRLTDRNH